MGCNSSNIQDDQPLYYLDVENNDIVCYNPGSINRLDKLSPVDQLTHVNKLEAGDYFHPGEICYLIDSKWLTKWYIYCDNRKKSDNPGKITNDRLIDSKIGLLHHYVQMRVDCRTVKRSVWVYLFELYGLYGPVLYFPGLFYFISIFTCCL